MSYLLDTCTVSDFFKKIPSVISNFELRSPKQMHISTISVMEIEYGLKLNYDRETKIRPLWESLLECISILPFSHACACASAELRAQLKTQGQPIGPYDILLAGSAIQYNLTFVTSNGKEFRRIPTLRVEDWRF